MTNFLIFGPPGSGKGTQSEKLAIKYNLVHLSTGDMLREETSSESELGKRVEQIMKNGELVPDEVVIAMIENRIENSQGVAGFLFDGFPRTCDQAVALDEMLEMKGTKITSMLVLDVNREELIKRLRTRAEVSGRSDDMDVSVIENRIAVYKEKTEPIVDYYSNQNKCDLIEGEGKVDDIFNRISKVIEKYI